MTHAVEPSDGEHLAVEGNAEHAFLHHGEASRLFAVVVNCFKYDCSHEARSMTQEPLCNWPYRWVEIRPGGGGHTHRSSLPLAEHNGTKVGVIRGYNLSTRFLFSKCWPGVGLFWWTDS